MKHSPSTTPTIVSFEFAGRKRLRSRDRFWIVTDIESYTSSLYPWSVPQQWYRAGALCLDTNRLALVEFSVDDVKAMLKARIQPAPWKSPQLCGLELTRIYHGDREKGRFREKVTLIELEPGLLKQGPTLRKHFEREMGRRGNSTPGMWQHIEEWAKRENAIEAAALSFDRWFSAGDVKKIVGSDINVSPILCRMADDGILVRNGKTKKGAKYMRTAPGLVERADWAG